MDLTIAIRAIDAAQAAFQSVRQGLGGIGDAIERNQRRFAIGSAAIVGGLGAMALGARDQIRSQAQLAQSLRNVGAEVGPVAAELEDLIASLQKTTGVSDELQRMALTQLISSLGDTEQAVAALPLALDLAAVTGRSLQSVSQGLGNVLSGETTRVRGLAVAFEDSAGFGERLAEIQRRVGGSAEEGADDLSKMLASLADVKDEIGILILEGLAPFIELIRDLADRFVNLSEPMKVFILGLTALSAGFLGFLAIVPQIVTGLQLVRKAILLLQTQSGIGLVVAALGLLATNAAAAAIVLEDTGSSTDLAAEAARKLAEEQENAGQRTDELGRQLEAGAESANEFSEAIKSITQSLQPLTEQQRAAQQAVDLIAESLEASGRDAEAFRERADAAMQSFAVESGLAAEQLQVGQDLLVELAGRVGPDAAAILEELASEASGVAESADDASDMLDEMATSAENAGEKAAGAAEKLTDAAEQIPSVVEDAGAATTDGLASMGSSIDDVSNRVEMLGVTIASSIAPPAEQAAADFGTAISPIPTLAQATMDATAAVVQETSQRIVAQASRFGSLDSGGRFGVLGSGSQIGAGTLGPIDPVLGVARGSTIGSFTPSDEFLATQNAGGGLGGGTTIDRRNYGTIRLVFPGVTDGGAVLDVIDGLADL